MLQVFKKETSLSTEQGTCTCFGLAVPQGFLGKWYLSRVWMRNRIWPDKVERQEYFRRKKEFV